MSEHEPRDDEKFHQKAWGPHPERASLICDISWHRERAEWHTLRADYYADVLIKGETESTTDTEEAEGIDE